MKRIEPGGGALEAAPAVPPAAAGADAPASRARELLAQGPALVDALGHDAAEAMAASLPLMERAASDTRELLEVNQALVPLMSALKGGARRLGWWQWFTGAKLERDVFFHDLQARIERLTRQGEQGLLALRAQALALKDEDAAMAAHIARLDAEVAAGQWLLGPEGQAACERAGLDVGDRARLARRVGNLQAMSTATQLTRNQFGVALQHARSVADRFTETRNLLLPLWKQAMGFELFSQRLGRTEGS